uniref:Uncharacterized protein n=1 Tax=Panagrolaimus sp. ES5 TaxID=591445 RepID=A0AC34FZ97_9BILA
MATTDLVPESNLHQHQLPQQQQHQHLQRQFPHQRQHRQHSNSQHHYIRRRLRQQLPPQAERIHGLDIEPLWAYAKEIRNNLFDAITDTEIHKIIRKYWIYISEHYNIYYYREGTFLMLKALNPILSPQEDAQKCLHLAYCLLDTFETTMMLKPQDQQTEILNTFVSVSLWKSVFHFVAAKEIIQSPACIKLLNFDNPEDETRSRIIQKYLSRINSDLIPSKTFEGRERLLKQLLNLGCTFIIFLKEEDCNASAEVLLNGKSYQVKNPSGNIWTPAYISFKKEKEKIGETALEDYTKRPEFVVFDMVRLLGRSSDEIFPQSSWRFSLAQNPKNSNSVVYEVETWQDRRLITPEFALGLYLKALRRLAETASKHSQTRVAIFVPAYFQTQQNNALKEACTWAGLSLVQTMQYSRDKYFLQ